MQAPSSSINPTPLAHADNQGIHQPLIIIRSFLFSGRPCVRETNESRSNDQRFCNRMLQLRTPVDGPKEITRYSNHIEHWDLNIEHWDLNIEHWTTCLKRTSNKLKSSWILDPISTSFQNI
ncbi:hypothetical protein TNCV_2313321 [Trichonephila clavipes]|nr:hypothetical protein TNCV_2313321 [Trichonephila clavipes]